MTAAEIFGIICFVFTIILSGIIIKDCWEYLSITDVLSLLLISLSIFGIYNTII